MIEVACATDDHYAPHCGAMLHSLFANNRPENFRVHLLHGPALSQLNQAFFIRLADQFNAKINFVAVSDNLVGEFPSKRFHVSCWYRILLPALLPDISRVLYLDADMIVMGDIRPLWDTHLNGNIFGAVINPLYPFMPDRASEQLGLSDRREYLNSGVLLIDLHLMQSASVSEHVLNYALRHPDNMWPEQDALSVVCRGRWLPLHPQWNAQTTFFDLNPAQLPFSREISEAAKSKPQIVHFIGPLKPWSYLCRHPLQHQYEKHRRQSPWPEYQLEGRTLFNFFLKFFSLSSQVAITNMINKLVTLPRRVFRKITGRSKPWSMRIMKHFSSRYPSATFVQIGSNDGKKHDPIYASLMKYKWTGVMVEPVKYVFERLRANYESFVRIRLENVAVAKTAGSMPFYHLAKASAADREKLPPWYDELGSFNKNVVLKHVEQIPDLEERLICTQVPCVTFSELCIRNGIEAVDLIHMDTEGYDYEIIKSIDFASARPILLIYEHKHLNDVDRLECKQKLQNLGYWLYETDADTWCADSRVRDGRHAAFLKDWTRQSRH